MRVGGKETFAWSRALAYGLEVLMRQPGNDNNMEGGRALGTDVG